MAVTTGHRVCTVWTAPRTRIVCSFMGPIQSKPNGRACLVGHGGDALTGPLQTVLKVGTGQVSCVGWERLWN